ncbi:MAG TPA: hypothetical protein DIS66_03880 [Candidatus Omnitrophica bacterium]|nr:hypothetical protein [Candidatus Omnitrophota bacterium]
MRILIGTWLGLLFFCLSPSIEAATENAPSFPRLYLNEQSETPTVQALSGLATRPLRLLVQRNNKSHHDALMQPYALGAFFGDDLRIEMAAPEKGMSVTLYKIFREPRGERYLSMPVSIYYGDASPAVYEEKIKPFREQFFIVVYEETHSSDVKNQHIRYFEERPRKLAITSFRTNWMLSSLKFKMRDFAAGDSRGSFTESAQDLVDKLINPKRIYMLRLWAKGTDNSNTSSIIPIEKTHE